MLGTEISDISEIPIRCIFCQSCGSPSNKNRSWWRNKPKGFPVPKEAAEYSLLPSYDDKIKEGKVPRLCASCRWTIGDQISLIKEEGLARLLKIEKENRDGRKSFAYILDPQAISQDNHTTAKREREITFKHEIVLQEKVAKRQRKQKEKDYKKRVEKERPIVIYGVTIETLGTEAEVSELVNKVDKMVHSQLNFYLDQFPLFNRTKKWKTLPSDEKKNEAQVSPSVWRTTCSNRKEGMVLIKKFSVKFPFFSFLTFLRLLIDKVDHPLISSKMAY